MQVSVKKTVFLNNLNDNCDTSAINYKLVGDGNMRREKSYQTIIYFYMLTLT